MNEAAALNVQRVFRGYIGKKAAEKAKTEKAEAEAEEKQPKLNKAAEYKEQRSLELKITHSPQDDEIYDSDNESHLLLAKIVD